MDLEQRVVELERRTTRYRNAMVLLVVGICAVAVVGATTDDGVIRGRELRLSNGAGQDVFVAKADSTGGDGEYWLCGCQPPTIYSKYRRNSSPMI